MCFSYFKGDNVSDCQRQCRCQRVAQVRILNSIYMNMTETSFTADKLQRLMQESFTSEDHVPPIKVTAEVSFEVSFFFFFCCHITCDDISPHTSHYPISLSLSGSGRLIYGTSSVRSVTFISISHPPPGVWTASESITATHIQTLLTIQIMKRRSGDFINTLAYTLHHTRAAV